MVRFEKHEFREHLADLNGEAVPSSFQRNLECDGSRFEGD
jgi:hypothetical protein